MKARQRPGQRQGPGRILIIRGGAIGDFVLTLPVFAALRAQLPSARVEVLGYRRIAALAVESGLADEARSIEARPLAGFFAEGGDLAPELQEYFSGFAIIVAFLYDPDGIFAANVARCSKAQYIAGPHRPDDRAGVHAAEVFLKPLERLAIFDADPVPRLRLPGAAAARSGPSTAPANPQLTPLLAVHPGSGSERKNWPEARWAEFLDDQMGTTRRRLLLVGGEAEGSRLERLAARLPAERVVRAFGLPLPTLAQQLSSCVALVGHDSGISHLAAAVGVPVLALWGETAEKVWCPRGERVRVLRARRGLADLEPAAVQAELDALLEPTG